jgi:hypothetical protein
LRFYHQNITHINVGWNQQANGLRYLRWGGDGEAVQPEK